jgi:hypothetical protein
MRYLAIVVSFLILFLALKPGIDAASVPAEVKTSCCGSDCVPKSADEESPLSQDNHDNDCNGHNCNPMKHCGCVIFQFHNQSFQIIAFYAQKKCAFEGHQIITSPFLSKIWQPPRVV